MAKGGAVFDGDGAGRRERAEHGRYLQRLQQLLVAQPLHEGFGAIGQSLVVVALVGKQHLGDGHGQAGVAAQIGPQQCDLGSAAGDAVGVDVVDEDLDDVSALATEGQRHALAFARTIQWQAVDEAVGAQHKHATLATRRHRHRHDRRHRRIASIRPGQGRDLQQSPGGDGGDAAAAIRGASLGDAQVREALVAKHGLALGDDAVAVFSHHRQDPSLPQKRRRTHIVVDDGVGVASAQQGCGFVEPRVLLQRGGRRQPADVDAPTDARHVGSAHAGGSNQAQPEGADQTTKTHPPPSTRLRVIATFPEFSTRRRTLAPGRATAAPCGADHNQATESTEVSSMWVDVGLAGAIPARRRA